MHAALWLFAHHVRPPVDDVAIPLRFKELVRSAGVNDGDRDSSGIDLRSPIDRHGGVGRHDHVRMPELAEFSEKAGVVDAARPEG